METRGKNRKGHRIEHTRMTKGQSGDNHRWTFTPAHWQKWLDKFNAEPNERDIERLTGIKEFRALCREPLDRGSDSSYSAPTRVEK